MMPSIGVAAALLVLLAGCVATVPEARADSSADDARIAAWLDERWADLSSRYPELQRPAVEVERVITSDDWVGVMGPCLADEGFPDLEVTEDGGISWESSAGQAGPIELAVFTCSARFPMDPRYSAPLDGDDIGRLYDYYVDELVPCLEAAGIQIPDPPSRQQFVDSYETDPGWLPYTYVMAPGTSLTQAESEKVQRDCPQGPPDSFFGID